MLVVLSVCVGGGGGGGGSTVESTVECHLSDHFGTEPMLDN